jgi:hypothetical protein
MFHEAPLLFIGKAPPPFEAGSKSDIAHIGERRVRDISLRLGITWSVVQQGDSRADQLNVTKLLR